MKLVWDYLGILLIAGKSGYKIIRYAFKRRPNQDPLPSGLGEPCPEPDYNSDEWIGWEQRVYRPRALNILAVKKEESPGLKEDSEEDSEEADFTRNVTEELSNRRAVQVKLESMH
jgi:hypothetical protein